MDNGVFDLTAANNDRTEEKPIAIVEIIVDGKVIQGWRVFAEYGVEALVADIAEKIEFYDEAK